MVRRTTVLGVAALAAALVAGDAFATTRLVSSTPSGRSAVAPLRRIQLHFSQPVSPSPSATLISTRMMMGSQMMSHTMAIDGAKAAVDPNDPKTVVVTAPSVLGSGDYKLTWKVSTKDSKELSGELAFTVK